jgi:predicted O-linked N-acetylglucosamine transferase (SPINDLY family)
MVSDMYTVPPNSDISEHYPEKMLYVPGSWMISDTKNLDEEMELIEATLSNATHTRAGLREQFGIPLDAVVFSYFGRTFKIDDRLFRAWGRIVEQVPQSYLVVAYYSTDTSLDPTYILKNMRSAWEGMGLAPDRFVAVPPFRRGEHVQVMRAMSDVSLDTVTYGGGTTGFEALYAGLPLVHFSGGEKMMQRAGGSLLAASGLDRELVAKDMEDYVRIAVRLGSDPAYRQRIKRHLEDIRFRRKPSIIFQPVIAIDAMVRGMKKAYGLWREGKPPRAIPYDETANEEAADAGRFRSSEL